MSYKLRANENGAIIVDDRPYQKGSLRALPMTLSNVEYAQLLIEDNFGNIIVPATPFGDFINDDGTPGAFASADDLKTFVEENFFFELGGGTGGGYQLDTPGNVTAALGADSASVDVDSSDPVDYAMGYHAKIATDVGFTADVLEASGTTLPVNVPGAVAGNTYHAELKATTTNPGNTDSHYGVAPGTVAIPVGGSVVIPWQDATSGAALYPNGTATDDFEMFAADGVTSLGEVSPDAAAVAAWNGDPASFAIGTATAADNTGLTVYINAGQTAPAVIFGNFEYWRVIASKSFTGNSLPGDCSILNSAGLISAPTYSVNGVHFAKEFIGDNASGIYFNTHYAFDRFRITGRFEMVANVPESPTVYNANNGGFGALNGINGTLFQHSGVAVVGLQTSGTAPFPTNHAAIFDVTNGAYSGSSTGTTAAVTPGDIIETQIEFSPVDVTARVQNITQSGAVASFNATTGCGGGGVWETPATWRMGGFLRCGEILVKSMDLKTNAGMYPDYILLGESVINGQAGATATNIANQLATLHPDRRIYKIAAGGSGFGNGMMAALFANALLLKPRNLIICQGINDAATMSAAAWLAAMDAAIVPFLAYGCNVIVCSPTASNDVDVSGYYTAGGAHTFASGATWHGGTFTATKAAGGNGLNPAYDCGDGNHLNGPGETALVGDVNTLIV